MKPTKRTIVLTGGGSGGHITPLLAVASELKQTDPNCHIVYIGQTGDHLSDIPAEHSAIDAVYSVRAGKFRRYHGEGWKQLLDLKTMALNIRDACYVVVGFWQSRALLKKLQPAVIFVKGGFVGVPVGLAAATRRIPYITHDSDAIPGLANRIIARWARYHAVALPKDIYQYPPDKTVATGIPLQEDFVTVTPELQQTYRKQIGVPLDAPVLFVIGGGLGSQRVNAAVVQAVPHLLHEFPKLHVIHGVGRANEHDVQSDYTQLLDDKARSRLEVFGFTKEVYKYSGAADLIITRAGATNIAEFAAQGKACIVIPSPFLAGGHQLKNTQVLEANDAVEAIDEVAVTEDPNRLAQLVSQLLKDAPRRAVLARQLHMLAKPDATQKIADLILSVADKG